MHTAPYILLDDQRTGQQKLFENPERIITAQNKAEVIEAFTAIEDAIARGKYIAGYFAYELGAALEQSLETDSNVNPKQTLIHIGIFGAPNATPNPQLLYGDTRLAAPDIALHPSWTQAEYTTRFDTLKSYIEAGHCYQANLTFPMHAKTQASAEQIFASFRQRQPGRYGALIRLGGPDIISFSPELFFERQARSHGDFMRMRPMKGTRPRSADNNVQDDTAIADAMRAEPKSQAENLMIVDLLRNDLSRLARPGSVEVPELFTLETYPTLHQMTSQVTASLREGVSWLDIFKGLYPCGSVTGAPKIRAMEIIRELESGPRGPYCGAIGFIGPDNSACFNVAIRTAVLDKGDLRYDVGSGVVYDSEAADEYTECLLKANILRAMPEHVFETFAVDARGHILRRGAHLARLQSACAQKKWPYPSAHINHLLNEASDKNIALRLRLQVCARGQAKLTHAPLIALETPLRIALSRYALSHELQISEIKTSQRNFYDGERARIKAAHDNIDEVIFTNASGALCEGSFTSLFVQIGGQLLTPPRTEGLLPGILRAELLKTGQAVERNLTMQDLIRAEAVFCGNSLRGLMPAYLVQSAAL